MYQVVLFIPSRGDLCVPSIKFTFISKNSFFSLILESKMENWRSLNEISMPMINESRQYILAIKVEWRRFHKQQNGIFEDGILYPNFVFVELFNWLPFFIHCHSWDHIYTRIRKHGIISLNEELRAIFFRFEPNRVETFANTLGY